MARQAPRYARPESAVIGALVDLGFSQYEARTYAGLIGRGPMTGYAVAKEAQGDAVIEADRRGVRVDVLTFGEAPFAVEHGAVLRHSSTDGTVYRHHQARHLALACDSSAALWALAPEGTEWEAVWAADDTLLTALVKGFIRHDLFGQRMFRDFGPEMRARYGAGLEGLFESHFSNEPG